MKTLYEPAEVGAAKFKAECLQLLDDVKNKGISYTITKHGTPWAQLVPIVQQAEDDPLDFFHIADGKVLGDIESPFAPLKDYEELK